MSDTICAISTPPGIGGISIVRLSGDNSLNIVKKIFKRFPEKIESHRIYYGHIIFENEIVDEVLVNVMLSPKSYTKEDVVEINCHGGLIVAKKILEILIKCGARLAEPGEFTKRAFLNGRINLIQAEAVVNLINAKSEKALKIFEKQLKGETNKKIEKLKKKLINISSIIESYIDFEEDIEIIDISKIKSNLKKIKKNVEEILNSYMFSKSLIEGISIVIAGAPNSGKSSLLNYFLKKNRAIISDIPGTTRDTIEEDIFFKNFSVKFIDTAGIRDSFDEIEKEGIKRTYEKLDEADIIIYLYDIEKGIEEYEKQLIEKLKKKKKIIICANKIDKFEKNTINITINIPENVIPISVKEKINIDKLENKIVSLLESYFNYSEENILITNLRQKEIFSNILNKLNNILKDFDLLYIDIIAYEIREILNELGKLTGEITTEDILDNIFSQFCIGK